MSQARIPLRPSAQVAGAGTTTGGDQPLRNSFSTLTAVLDVSAVGDATEAADTLDVYIDASHDEGTTYFNIGRFARITGVNGVKAWNTLELTGAITPGSHAESVITSDATNVSDAIAATAVLTSDETNVSDAETVTLGDTVYRFKEVMAQAYDVQIGVDADTSLANLVAAINASGTPGTEYFAGTLIHPTVTAGAVTAHATTLTANTAGAAGNSIAKAETSAHLDFDGAGAFLTGGADPETVTVGSTVYRFKNTLAQAYDVKIGASAAATLDNLKAAINASGTPGVEYFAGTLAHPTVVATDNADTTQKIVARVPGTAANTAATTTTATHLSWPDTTLGGGTGASNPGVAAETVTVGSVTYSFLDVLSETNGAAAIANQVLFGADSAAALDNLKLAINSGATAGTNYSTGTTAQTLLQAIDNTDTSQKVEALTQSADNNSIVTTETLANGAWSEGATLAHGTLGPGVAARQSLTWSPALAESSQPVSLISDISSTSGAVRQVGFGDMIRYRGVVAGSEPDFTYSVHCVAKE